VGIEPVYLLCKYGSPFLKYSQNVRSAQLHFIFPYFSYILVKTVINRFHCGDLSLRPNLALGSNFRSLFLCLLRRNF